MKQRKIRVLLDLSMALLGYSGIPQDTRLLFKTLSLCPEVDVTGLLYPCAVRVRQHKFRPPKATRADRLANQACFLWGVGEQAGNSGPLPMRVLRRLIAELTVRTRRSAALEPADSAAFHQVLWRMLFAQSLQAEDIPLVRDGKFLFMNVSAEAMHRRMVANRSPVRLDTRDFDFFIVQTARTLRVSPNTKQIVRYHDMIPIMHADTMPRLHDIRWHHNSIQRSLGSYFVCNSEPTRQNLVDVFPELSQRSATIPYMLSDAYRPEVNEATINSIIRTRRSTATGSGPRRPLKRTPRYIMGVSTLEPRKNFQGLIQAFNSVRFRRSVARAVPRLKLLIVGSPGWRFEPILNAMRELVAQGDIIHLESVSSDELRVLYSQAEALVYPSHAEGFGFPPLEAMQCDVPVIASDIPEHRWVLGDAALYCNSYDPNSIADAIERLIASEDSPALVRELVARGRERVERYTLESCRQQWLALLERLQAGQPIASTTNQAPLTLHSPMDRAA
jgi:glycosyltransferase involved in cell wall biosynthesis